MSENTGKNKLSIDVMAAIEESARCLLCHDAPCSAACPAQTDPAKFIRSIRFENYKGSAQTIRENNILGGICARVCPYDKYCEGACLKTGIDRPIRIGFLQQFATDYERAVGLDVLEKAESNGVKIAVIGSGPAGLSASAKLAQKGYEVTVFEENEKLGGWLTYGIPEERLPQDIVEYEIGYVKNLGVTFKTGIKVGRDISIAELQNSGFSAVLIAVGLHINSQLGIKGEECSNVVDGTDFLSQAKNGGVNVGKKVIVIGGGDVAIDCAMVAKSLGAQDVKILYRRTIEKMPANTEEKNMLFGAQIPIFTGFKPTEIIAKDGVAISIKAAGMFDDSAIELPTDMIITAIGQKAEDVKKLFGIAVADGGMIEVTGYKTSVSGVFACGDITQGDKTVVFAVQAGKDAADEIDRYIQENIQSYKAGVK